MYVILIIIIKEIDNFVCGFIFYLMMINYLLRVELMFIFCLINEV